MYLPLFVLQSWKSNVLTKIDVTLNIIGLHDFEKISHCDYSGCAIMTDCEIRLVIFEGISIYTSLFSFSLKNDEMNDFNVILLYQNNSNNHIFS